MRRERPVLTARWTELLVLNFRVPRDLLAPLAPLDTEPDLYDGQAYLSIVGFRFHGTRLFGLPIPGHTRFVEINLRYYVRRFVEGQPRRGVVFVKEIAPRRAIGLTANWLYNENYITRPMRAGHHIADTRLAPGDRLEYAWRTKTIPLPFREGRGEGSARRARAAHWNHLSARIAAPPQLPASGSFEEFIIENYWGFVRGRDGCTREYQVAHDPWRVAPADEVEWNCDLAATYDSPFAEYLAAQPTSALVADGSPIQLFRGRCI
ncbi:MAG TPA: DUF2071 domain-containing protein [Lacipirellulaceae bacterium]|nr:DUF2071 domain-containing protein [Lacipirellulaceae bacterium]